jgi:hypothetical protein
MTTARVGVDITAFDRTATAFNSATQRMERFSSKAAGMLKGFGSAFTVTAVVSGLTSVIDAMDEINNAAQRMGVGVESLSQLGYAAKLNEVSFEKLGMASKTLNENLSKIGAGKGGEASAALKAIGVSAFDSAGKLKSVDQVIIDAAGKFSQYEDGANKVALASAIFGKKVGSEMIPMLNAGSEALREAQGEAVRFGLKLDGPAAQAASEFNDNLDRLGGFVQGVARLLVTDLLPQVNGLVNKFLETANAGETVQNVLSGIESAATAAANATSELSTAMAYYENGKTLAAYIGRDINRSIFMDEAGRDEAFRIYKEQTAAIWKRTEALQAVSDVVSNRAEKGSLPKPKLKLESAPLFDRGEGRGGGGVRKPKKLRTSEVDEQLLESKRIFEAMQTPLEAHTARMKNLNGLLDKGYLSQQTYNRSVLDSQNQYVSAAAAMNTFEVQAETTFSVIDEMSGLFKDELGGALESIIDRTSSVKDAFHSMAMSILQSSTKLSLNRGLQQLFAGGGEHALYGGGGEGGGFWSGLFGSFFGGNRASGGQMRKGNYYEINENGQELFAPGQDGMMIPNAALRGGGGGVTIIDQRSNGAPVQPQQQSDGSWLLVLRDMAREEAHGAIKEAMPNYGLTTRNRVR